METHSKDRVAFVSQGMILDKALIITANMTKMYMHYLAESHFCLTLVCQALAALTLIVCL